MTEKSEVSALLTFENWEDLVKYTKIASESKIKVSGPRAIAKEVLRLEQKTDLSQVNDKILIEVLSGVQEILKTLPLVGSKDFAKENISAMRLNLLDHLKTHHSEHQKREEPHDENIQNMIVIQGS